MTQLNIRVPLALLTQLATFGLSNAAPGDLDPTFNGSGTVITAVLGTSLIPFDLALQADGKVVVVGSASTGNQAHFALLRYDATGTLDSGFGSGGIVVDPIAPDGDVARAVALQSDGGIVVVGSVKTPPIGHTDIVVARYDGNGDRDPTFGSGGVVITPVTPFSDEALAVAIQSDGKIVVAGTALLRYEADGTIDSGFVGDGGATFFPPSTSVVLDQADRILLAFPDFLSNSGRVRRFASDGSPDSSFGGDGSIELETPAFRLALQSDGNIVVGGGSVGLALLARLLPSGTLDPSFGTGGYASAPFVMGSASGVAIQPDGKILVAGEPGVPGNAVTALSRFESDGQLDTGFALFGLATTSFGGGAASLGVANLKLAPSGNVVVAGREDFQRIAVARYVTTTGPCPVGISDADGDGRCNETDPCTNVAGGRDFLTMPNPRLVLSRIHLDPVAGNDRMTLTAIFRLPSGVQLTDLDLSRTGARLLLESATGSPRVFAPLPAGNYTPLVGRGWRRLGQGKAWLYRDSTESPSANGIEPPGGIRRFSVADRSRFAPGEVKVMVSAPRANLTVTPADLPLDVAVVLGQQIEAAAGTCGESNFGAGECAFNTAGTRVLCTN